MFVYCVETHQTEKVVEMKRKVIPRLNASTSQRLEETDEIRFQGRAYGVRPWQKVGINLLLDTKNQ